MYRTIGREDAVFAYGIYAHAKKKAEELGLKLAEYGDFYGDNVSYAYWNETGNRNDVEKVMVYYIFGEDGKPKTEMSEADRRLIGYAFGSESVLDD